MLTFQLFNNFFSSSVWSTVIVLLPNYMFKPSNKKPIVAPNRYLLKVKTHKVPEIYDKRLTLNTQCSKTSDNNDNTKTMWHQFPHSIAEITRATDFKWTPLGSRTTQGWKDNPRTKWFDIKSSLPRKKKVSRSRFSMWCYA